MSKKRLIEADILRGMAILAVILIHVLNIPVRNLAEISPDNFFFYLHGALNFAVPAFFILSAALTAYSLGEEALNLKAFYGKRLLRTFLPYLFWSLAYLAAMFAIGVVTWEDFFSIGKWAEWILTGRAYTHFYFIALLMQFYLLAPFLLWLARKVKNSFVQAAAVALIMQSAVYWLNRLYIFSKWTYFSSSYFWYISLGFMGLYFGLNYSKFIEKIKDKGSILAFLTVIFGGLVLYQNHLVMHRMYLGKSLLIGGLTVDLSWFTLIWYLYVLCATLTLWVTALKLSVSDMGRILADIGVHSLGIYYIHPGLTFFLGHYCWVTDSWLLAFISVVAWVVISALSYFTVSFGKRIPIGAFAFGFSKPGK